MEHGAPSCVTNAVFWPQSLITYRGVPRNEILASQTPYNTFIFGLKVTAHPQKGPKNALFEGEKAKIWAILGLFWGPKFRFSPRFAIKTLSRSEIFYSEVSQDFLKLC